MKPSETIIALRKVWADMVKNSHPDVSKFETEDAFVFFHIDEIAEESRKKR